MSLYRCAACGSRNVVTDSQKEGYDYVKGAVGTVLLGVGGGAAGINGKTTRVFKCPDCGLTMNYSMPEDLKTIIDLGVSDLAVREKLTISGMKVDWEILTNRYKNIEKGRADQELEERLKDKEKNLAEQRKLYLNEESSEYNEYINSNYMNERTAQLFEIVNTKIVERADEASLLKTQLKHAVKINENNQALANYIYFILTCVDKADNIELSLILQHCFEIETTVQRITAIARLLYADDLIERFDEGRKRYYRIVSTTSIRENDAEDDMGENTDLDFTLEENKKMFESVQTSVITSNVQQTIYENTQRANEPMQTNTKNTNVQQTMYYKTTKNEQEAKSSSAKKVAKVVISIPALIVNIFVTLLMFSTEISIINDVMAEPTVKQFVAMVFCGLGTIVSIPGFGRLLFRKKYGIPQRILRWVLFMVIMVTDFILMGFFF